MPHFDTATLEMIRNILKGVTIPEKANIANQVGEDTVGASSIPIYLNNGVPTAATPSSMSVASAEYLSRADTIGTSFNINDSSDVWYGFYTVSTGNATSARFSAMMAVHNTVEDADNIIAGIIQINAYIGSDGNFDTDNSELSVIAGNIEPDDLLISFNGTSISLYCQPPISISSSSGRIIRVVELSRYISNNLITATLGTIDWITDVSSLSSVKYGVRRNLASKAEMAEKDSNGNVIVDTYLSKDELDAEVSSKFEYSDGILYVHL